jgi:hypothetical protein
LRAFPGLSCRRASRLDDRAGRTCTSWKNCVYLSILASGISTSSMGPFGGGSGARCSSFLLILRVKLRNSPGGEPMPNGDECCDDEFDDDKPSMARPPTPAGSVRTDACDVDRRPWNVAARRRPHSEPMDFQRPSSGRPPYDVLSSRLEKGSRVVCERVGRDDDEPTFGVEAALANADEGAKKDVSDGLPRARPMSELSVRTRRGRLAAAVAGRFAGVGKRNVSWSAVTSIGEPVLRSMSATCRLDEASPAVRGRSR